MSVVFNENKTLTVGEALAMLPDSNHVHAFVETSQCLISEEWPRAQIESAIRNAHSLELGGDHGATAGHSLVVWTSPASSIYVATKAADQ